jgi:hypothetical protein
MAEDRIDAITRLLGQAEAAHGTYEATELKGVYDTEWPHWYATYAVEHGVGSLIGHPVTEDQLAQFLEASYADFERADPKPTETWAAYAARRIAREL